MITLLDIDGDAVTGGASTYFPTGRHYRLRAAQPFVLLDRAMDRALAADLLAFADSEEVER